MLSHSVMSDFATPRTAARQVPLPTEFSKQEYQSGLPFPTPENLPNSGIKPSSPVLPGGFFTTEQRGKLIEHLILI